MHPFSLNIRGQLLDYSRPLVMGIINATPDSFYAESRAQAYDDIVKAAGLMITEGVDIIDVGAYSTRPGHVQVNEDEEIHRLSVALSAIRSVSADIPLSVDTFRPSVAKKSILKYGADIINDISGGCDEMYDVAAVNKAPYILMYYRDRSIGHNDILADMLEFLGKRISSLKLKGVSDIIIDPGFGFGKTIDENYHILNNLDILNELNLPVLVGISRKSMIKTPLGISADDAMPATVALDTIALAKGASILRVHDVASARQTADIYHYSLYK